MRKFGVPGQSGLTNAPNLRGLTCEGAMRGLQLRIRTATRMLLAGLVFGALLVPSAAMAHGQPADIVFFGPFGRPTLRCLHIMGRAARRCVSQVLSVQRACLDRQLNGNSCDTAARDGQINAAKQVGRDAVNSCLGGQLTELRMIGFDEAKADVARACDQGTAAATLAYTPGLTSPPAAAPIRQCVARTAELSQKFLNFAVRHKSHMLDRMAGRAFLPSQKFRMMDAMHQRMASPQADLVAALAQACPDFATLYGDTAAAVLTSVQHLGDCVVGSTYVQTAITCPPTPTPVP